MNTYRLKRKYERGVNKWKEQIITELNKDNTYFIEDSKELYNIINNSLITINFTYYSYY